ncbi:MAG TPA: hypothetical protein VF273_01090 [Pelobium sp.]
MKKIILGLFAIGMIAGACKKSDNPQTAGGGTEGTILTEVRYWTPSKGESSVKITGITTDGDGKITALEKFSTSGELMIKYDGIEKNTAGKIIKISGTSIYKQNTPIKTEFEYTGDNITKSITTDGDAITFNTYSYDTSNRLTENASYSSANAKKPSSKVVFTYTGTDVNPASRRTEYTLNGLPVAETTSFKYDDKNNPFLKASPILYYINSGDLNTHNVIEAKDSDRTITFKYEYNKSGYPVSKAFSTDAGQKFTYK